MLTYAASALTELPNYAAARVVVIGDLMLDRFWSGSTGRISPEAPVPVVQVQQQDDRAGGAANVAINLAALGASAHLVGLVGQDDSARALAEVLDKQQVGHQLIASESHQTITKLRVLSRHQQLLRMDFERSFADAPELSALNEVHFEPGSVVVFSDYAKGTLTDIEQLIARARAAGCKVVIDPKGQDFSRYAGAHLLTPNRAEFEAVVGRCQDADELSTRAAALCKQLELGYVLLTRSEEGMTLYSTEGELLHLPTKAREVFDVTGAGDTVISTLAASLSAGASMQAACELANLAAGVVVGKLGTSSVSANELRAALSLERHMAAGVSAEALVPRVRQLQAEGKTVVMTNGCFDIVHAGHVSYLSQAAELGDVLVVALNSDDSVARLKGPNRPINPLSQRLQVIAGLASVDYVVSFDSDTPQQLIAAVLPDILVKGGDYNISDIVGAQDVIDNGGSVRVLGFEEGISTSNIIARAKY